MELNNIFKLLLISWESNLRLSLKLKNIYNNKALIHALIAVAAAMPISLIDWINNMERTIFTATLTMEI